ncbi:uncharacterized protein LOC125038869 [Penaeus chinensis]|uniref:uncharacterized protein LOC125038869 n=1 Tax=Penaeus chinensis TaxID=139456 RepID=UPI001FB66ACD|nr:uncharacterized protein LOC125038869 [Penaeus chinensis]
MSFMVVVSTGLPLEDFKYKRAREEVSELLETKMKMKWIQFKESVTETAEKTVLGLKRRNHQDWFNENDSAIEELLAKKNKPFMEWQNDPGSSTKKERFKSYQSLAQRQIRRMHDQWWEKKADEIQAFADSNNSKQFFNSLKAVHGPPKSCSTPLLSADGVTLIKDKAAIRERWKEHFSQLLNRPSSVDQSTLYLTRSLRDQSLKNSTTFPPLEEVQKAMRQVSSGKAPGRDEIAAEIYEALQVFHSVLISIWEEEEMPADLRDALIVSLFKDKGLRADCGNHRGYPFSPLLKTKVARIMLNRLIPSIAEKNFPESQCGFRRNRTFDTVNREALWVILGKLGSPAKFSKLTQLFHDNMTGEVLTDGETSERFGITNGVKQGCVLAPVLFNLLFIQVLLHASKDLEFGIYIRYRLDGSRSRKPQLFGLTISLRKTEALLQPAPASSPLQPSITIDDKQLENVESFRYLDSSISNDGSLDKGIQTRIQKAKALGRLRTKALQHVKKLEQFHTRALRSIMRIRWQDRVTIQEVLDRANSTSIEAKILQAQIRWTGNVIRMDETRIPRQIFYGA